MNKILVYLVLSLAVLKLARSTMSHTEFATSVNSNLRMLAVRSSGGLGGAARFLGSSFNSNLYSLPMSGKVRRTPWSGDYNAWRYGGIAARYGKQDTRWKSYLRSIRSYSQPADFNANKDNGDFADRVANIYSSAEKYDLLVGDTDFTLTKANKNYGMRLGGARGDVSSWMGMCDGWATASWMFPEPQHAVTFKGATGVPVKFWVDDIKNLASLYWRGSKYDNRMVGSRHGAINPAVWFVIWANNVGLRGRNMNIEPMADNEIWNHPALSYQARITGGGGNGAAGSNILRQAGANSPNGTARMVSMQMQITYVTETTNSINPKPRKTGNSRYTFVLHVGSDGNIIGGVWTSRKRPSYIWGPAKDVGDGSSGLGSPGLAKSKSAGNLMPLRSVVDMLMNAAS
jgi:hypothetical protein